MQGKVVLATNSTDRVSAHMEKMARVPPDTWGLKVLKGQRLVCFGVRFLMRERPRESLPEAGDTLPPYISGLKMVRQEFTRKE